MTDSDPGEVTRLIESASTGDRAAWDKLLPLVYEELRGMAHWQRQQNRALATLNTTGLVHEAYLKLVGKEGVSWQNRVHFYRIAAQVMRDIIVDYARRQRAAKRGGGAPHVALSEIDELPEIRVEEVIALDEALRKLEAVSPQQSRIVELRYFAGLTLAETADVLGVSVSTVQRGWLSARAWLYHVMQACERGT